MMDEEESQIEDLSQEMQQSDKKGGVNIFWTYLQHEPPIKPSLILCQKQDIRSINDSLTIGDSP